MTSFPEVITFFAAIAVALAVALEEDDEMAFLIRSEYALVLGRNVAVLVSTVAAIAVATCTGCAVAGCESDAFRISSSAFSNLTVDSTPASSDIVPSSSAGSVAAGVGVSLATVGST